MNLAVGTVETHNALWDAQTEKQPFTVQCIQKAGDDGTDDVVRQAEALIGSISEEGPDNDVASLLMELTLQEALKIVVPPVAP